MSTKLLLVDYEKDWEAVHRLLAPLATDANQGYTLVEADFKNDPTCYVLKVTDLDTENILGVAIWFIHSYEKKRRIRVGPEVAQHVYLYDIVTSPIENNASCASALMQWGVDRADSLGLEIWTHTDSPEALVYRSNNFSKLEELVTESQSIWSLRRVAVDNRRKHQYAYIHMDGF